MLKPIHYISPRICINQNTLVRSYRKVMYLIVLPTEKIRLLVEEKLLIVGKTEITEESKKSSVFLTTLKSFIVK
ncbi:MAG: hypothetical protein WBZ36_03735 [Candidatus Nitrosopolaris sp.]